MTDDELLHAFLFCISYIAIGLYWYFLPCQSFLHLGMMIAQTGQINKLDVMYPTMYDPVHTFILQLFVGYGLIFVPLFIYVFLKEK